MKLSMIPKAPAFFLAIFLSASASVHAQHMAMQMQHQNTFLSMMDAMMMRMDAVVVGISAEHDFVEQMMPHHQGAVEMASYEIQYGKNFTMVQLAKSILAEQTNELQQMNLYKKRLPSTIADTPKGYKEAMDKSMEVMMKSMPENSELSEIDVAFAKVMIPHHQAAVDMAKVVLRFSKDLQTVAFAKQLISSEEIEIEQMLSFLNKL